MGQPSIDLRPSRLDIDALLKGTSLHTAIRRAVIDALEERALLFGSEAPSDIPPDANGRQLRRTDTDNSEGCAIAGRRLGLARRLGTARYSSS